MLVQTIDVIQDHDHEEVVTSIVDTGGLVKTISQRIVHTLTLYPKLSPSMLQVGIGTGLSPALWHPVLEALIKEGTVRRAHVRMINPVTSRDQMYTILELARETSER